MKKLLAGLLGVALLSACSADPAAPAAMTEAAGPPQGIVPVHFAYVCEACTTWTLRGAGGLE